LLHRSPGTYGTSCDLPCTLYDHAAGTPKPLPTPLDPDQTLPPLPSLGLLCPGVQSPPRPPCTQQSCCTGWISPQAWPLHPPRRQTCLSSDVFLPSQRVCFCLHTASQSTTAVLSVTEGVGGPASHTGHEDRGIAFAIVCHGPCPPGRGKQAFGVPAQCAVWCWLCG
jgi:hypothetical protein